MSEGCDLRVLARIIDQESARLCAIIDSSRSAEVRQGALAELKELARNAAVILSGLEEELMDFDDADAELPAAA